MRTSMENKILSQLKIILQELTWLKTVEYQRIRMTAADFQANEMPGVQIFDDGQLNAHARTQIDVGWKIIVELFQQTLPDGSHDAGLLYDRKYDIERQIGYNVKLRIPAVSDEGRMIHVKYLDARTNIFMIDGVSVVQLRFEILFGKPYTDDC